MRTNRELVFVLWCRLTGLDLDEVSAGEREAFFACPQVTGLSAAPYPELLDAGIASASRGSLSLDQWLMSVRQIAQTETRTLERPAAM